MKYLLHLLLSLALVLPPVAAFADSLSPLAAGADYDAVFEKAARLGLISGAVVVVGNRDGILFERSFGTASPVLPAAPVTIDTLFDIASLTKVVATAPAVMKLVEERRLSLVDPVQKWFQEFSSPEKKDLLVLHLLTHTSGLDDVSCSLTDPLHGFITAAASQKGKGEIGSRFRYADINFILLGDLVRRVSGTTLDRYAVENIFRPLGMTATTFNPVSSQLDRCAPTVGDGGLNLGRVQDFNARQMSGVAGHAGVFSSARDLSRFCMTMLNGGVLDGKRVLSRLSVEQMTAPYFSRGGSVVRGLGWDIASPFSAPRGKRFSTESFGHTGYSGSSLWIDPQKNLFVVLLTTRTNYRNIAEFNQLRADVSTLAATLFSPSLQGDEELSDLLARH